MNRVINQELLKDETILWEGAPDGSKIISKSDWFLIPFSLLWGGFAIFWEVTTIRFGAPFMFSLFGVPFVLLGLYFMLGRFFYKAYVNRNTSYFITNKRILIIKEVRNMSIEAEFIHSIPVILKESNSNGMGTIFYGNNRGMYSNTGLDFFVKNNRYGMPSLAVYDIAQVDQVYKIISEVRNTQLNA